MIFHWTEIRTTKSAKCLWSQRWTKTGSAQVVYSKQCIYAFFALHFKRSSWAHPSAKAASDRTRTTKFQGSHWFSFRHYLLPLPSWVIQTVLAIRLSSVTEGAGALRSITRCPCRLLTLVDLFLHNEDNRRERERERDGYICPERIITQAARFRNKFISQAYVDRVRAETRMQQELPVLKR